MDLSIVIPVYLAENILEELIKRNVKVLNTIGVTYEIILVDDCGPDNSWQKIIELSEKYSEVKGLRLSRNFGQHNALKAGLSNAKGNACIVMDCDLQDDPIYIIDLYEEYKKGYEIVYTEKILRKHSFFKDFTANIFSKVFNYLTDNKNIVSNTKVGSYSLICRQVVNEFINFPDYQFHYLMVLRWLGFSNTTVKIKHKERFSGKSSYTFKKLLDHAFVGIVYHSNKLLKISTYLGFIISFISSLVGIGIIIKYFISGFRSGWTSLFVLMLFSLGIILIFLGILGIYIAKIFDQSKSRPQFIIHKTKNI